MNLPSSQPQASSKSAIEGVYRNPLRLVSLRTKLLVGFSIAFSLVFAGAFLWFYNFATEKAMTRLEEDMFNTLKGAAEGVDVEELLSLYANGQPNRAGFSDDPRYVNQLQWFATVNRIEPRAWLYSFVVSPAGENRRILWYEPSKIEPGKPAQIYLVDLWSKHDPSKAARFLQPEFVSPVVTRVITEGRTLPHEEIYEDKWGRWLSAYAPLRDENDRIVAVLGLDIKADYVFQIQEAIRQRILASFIITYGILFVLIYFLSGALTRRLSHLTENAERIGEGDYSLNLPPLGQDPFPDEMHRLTLVFERMVEGIRNREQLIREGKQLEDEMRIALQEERELNELKSRFVSMVSHELRTPLTVLRTSMELLERYGSVASEEKRLEYFKRGRSAIQHMNQLLEDVLTIGKSEAGKLDFNPVMLDVKQFCSDLAEEMQLGLGATHLVYFQADGMCSEASLDPKLLRSILTNLLSNAIKYSPAGSQVDLHLTCEENQLIFAVSDRGIGIPTEDQPRLFEQFHRASNAGAIRGTGLGLSIVRECVEHHGGQITFESQEGEGTTFVVRLPLLTEQVVEDAAIG